MKEDIELLQKEVRLFTNKNSSFLDLLTITALQRADVHLDRASFCASMSNSETKIDFSPKLNRKETCAQFADNLSIIIDFYHFKDRPVPWKLDTHLRAAYVALCEAQYTL